MHKILEVKLGLLISSLQLKVRKEKRRQSSNKQKPYRI